MLIMQAEQLERGVKIWNNFLNEEVTFLAGPFKTLNRAEWFVTAYNHDGDVKLYNLNNLSLTRTLPEKGDHWVNAKGNNAFVVDVTGNFVIYKANRNDSDEQAFVTTVNHFTSRYRLY